MNRMHEANRQYWNSTRASKTERQTEEAGLWRLCCKEPHIAFDCEALEIIQEFVGDLDGKNVLSSAVATTMLHLHWQVSERKSPR